MRSLMRPGLAHPSSWKGWAPTPTIYLPTTTPAWTWTAWTQMHAGVAYPTWLVAVVMGEDGVANTGFRAQWAIGAPGSEVVIHEEYVHVNRQVSFYSPLSAPVFIPASTRLSVRLSSSIATQRGYCLALTLAASHPYIEKVLGAKQQIYRVEYTPVSGAPASITIFSTPASINTFSAWTQYWAASTFAYPVELVTSHPLSGISGPSIKDLVTQFGAGGAGSEVVIGEIGPGFWAGSGTYVAALRMPRGIVVPANARLALRIKNITDSTSIAGDNRGFGVRRVG